MARSPGDDLRMEAAGGGLKELVLRWFTETQAPIIMQNGNFPDWFQGLAARKDAEDLLRDKALGCFLIRLSDKAIGYILSYKGQERCRHFVITQDQDGQFVIAGDCQLFGSLAELIDHYKVSPIEPFGECLTSSCGQEDGGELYDVVCTKGTSGVSVQALRSMWDHKEDHQSEPGSNQKMKPHNEPASAHPPVLPSKSRNRKLTGTVSVDAASLSKVVPPVPKRGIPLGFVMGGSLPDTMPHPNETQTDSNRTQRLRRSPNQALTSDRDLFTSMDTNFPGDLCPAGVSYSGLNHAEGRSRSLPRLDDSNVEEDEKEEDYSNQPGSSSSTAPLKKVNCHTYSLLTLSEGLSSSRSEQHVLRSNPLYQSSETHRGSLVQVGDDMYAEVPREPTPAGQPKETYKMIPVQSNTYESLEDTKTTKSKSTWGKNNIKWKKFLPDYMKK